eukprot:m.16216 g.16216  ORF g.16216 m.16216 type:complete len:275 (-) comp6967_c0_seq1:411-1235(-)
MTTHKKCINTKYLGGPDRFPVPLEKVPWDVAYPEYAPVAYVAEAVRKQPVWADNPEKAKAGDYKWNRDQRRCSHEGEYEIVDGLPRNMHGRTGMTERGLLGQYGPNFAADPVVTRWKRNANGKLTDPKNPELEVVLIKRKDNGQWAIPGGMVEAGDTVSATLAKEFSEEALNMLDADPAEQQKILDGVDKLFKNGTKIYTGYVDDPRNTDQAWMETSCYNFHDDKGDVFDKFKLAAGDDAASVKWETITPELDLYASHNDFIKAVYHLRTGKRL